LFANVICRGLYKSLQPLRQDFELMCLNAIMFNTNGDEYWREARRFFEEVQRVFKLQKRKTQLSAYGAELVQAVNAYEVEVEAARIAKMKKRKATSGTENAAAAEGEPSYVPSKRSRVGTTEEAVVDTGSPTGWSEGFSEPPQDIIQEGVAQSSVASASVSGVSPPAPAPEPDFELDEQIYVPSALVPSPDPVSYLPCSVVSQCMEEAYLLMCHDCCLVCGCSGRYELMLFCIDCGEGVHTFCAEAPLSTMPEEARVGWRCMNCKICQCCRTNVENDSVGKMLYCEACDLAFHSQCLTPAVSSTPDGSWFCPGCVKCAACPLLAPSGRAQPCWGFDLAMCFECHKLTEEQRLVEEAKKLEQARLDMLRDSPDNCNVCFNPCAAEPVLMCTGCGRNTHVRCNAGNALPLLANDMEGHRDFLCMRCVDEYLPGCASHVGTGSSAAHLLQRVARIQRVRWVERQQVKQMKLAALEVERREVFESNRPVLKAVVVWASLRAQWFQSFQTSKLTGTAQTKLLLNFESARALRFLAVWRRRASSCPLPPSRRRANLLQGLDEDGSEMTPEKLVRMASLAAAFLEATNPETRSFVPRDEEIEPVLRFANSQPAFTTGASSFGRTITAALLEVSKLSCFLHFVLMQKRGSFVY
jgi:hypothetical protein